MSVQAHQSLSQDMAFELVATLFDQAGARVGQQAWRSGPASSSGARGPAAGPNSPWRWMVLSGTWSR